ncbi:hypothetical protein [Rhizobium leguminosarum]|uniref:hypothetical protein n=1 Tax=Rhizobium leguminosarum TaxID=384 RepID=UPI001FED9C66|nr:hypothetical protein [Rhizobium leguminosarum]
MAVKLLWTPRARVDVKQIFVEMGKGQRQAAERHFQQFRYKAGLLVDHSRLGERHLEIFHTADAGRSALGDPL